MSFWIARACALVGFALALAAGGSPALAAPPSNDNFANATAITVGQTLSGSNREATKETGEPTFPTNPGGRSVWWKFTPLYSAPITLETVGSTHYLGSPEGLDTLLAVYTGDTVDALTRISYNDDINAPTILQSRLQFQAQAGKTYWIAVDGYNAFAGTNSQGTILLTLVDNDDFDRAAIVTAGQPVWGNNVFSTRQSGEPSLGLGQNTAWWTFTAPSAGSYRFSTIGSDFNTTIGVYSGSSVNALTGRGNNDDIVSGVVLESEVVIALTSGEQVFIAVNGFKPVSGSTNIGNIALSVFLNSADMRSLKLSAGPSSGGHVIGAGYYPTASVLTITAIPASEDWAFYEWINVNEATTASNNRSYVFSLTVNRTLEAVFYPVYTITTSVSPPGSGTANPASEKRIKNSLFTRIATPAPGYDFVNWTENGSPIGTNPTYSSGLVTANRSIVANFVGTPRVVSVTASPPQGGTVTGGGIYAQGTPITLTATANAGYAFVNWTEGANVLSTSTNYGFNVAGAQTIVANFTVLHTLTLSALPVAGGTVAGGGTFVGSPIRTVTATAKPGYEFVSWTEGANVVSPTPVFTFILAVNRTLRANFRLRVPKNDLLVDRGPTGTWLFKNNATWLRIHTLSPNVMAVGDLNANGKDDTLLSFAAPAPVAQRGLWARLDNGPIAKIHPNTALKLAVGDVDNSNKADVIATFQGVVGTWQRLNNAGLWVKINVASALDIATGDLNGNKKDDVLITLATGVWVRYDNAGAWIRVDTVKPLLLATSDTDANGKAELAVGRGAAGIFARFNNAGLFIKQHAGNASLLSSGDPDGNKRADILAALPNGLWMRNAVNGVWGQLNALKPTAITAADLDRNGKDEVIAVLPKQGLRARMNNTAVWRVLLAAPQPEAVLATGVD